MKQYEVPEIHEAGNASDSLEDVGPKGRAV